MSGYVATFVATFLGVFTAVCALGLALAWGVDRYFDDRGGF